MRALRFAILALICTGCGGGHGSVVPPTNSGSQSIATPAPKGKVEFTILVPKATSSAHRPAYVSPATQSMTVNVTGSGSTATPTGFPMTVGLTPTSAGCTNTLASTQCTIQLSLNPGSFVASISTFDGTNGSGNLLSSAQAVPFTIVANQNNLIPLTLSGIPMQMLLTYPGNGKFSIVTTDADGNYIVGAGAPTFTVAQTGGVAAVTYTQPTTSAPNAFSIAATTTLGSEKLAVKAAYPAGETSGCTQTGAVCSRSFSVSNTQELFALDYDNSSVLGFSVPFTSSSESPSFTYGDYYPYGGAIALDPSNGNLFFAGGEYNESEPVYEVAAPYTGSASLLFSAYATGLAVDSSHNLFVASYDSSPSAVKEYASPYTGSAINTFGSGTYPWTVALDASNDLFVGNFDESYLQEFPYVSGSYGSAVDINTDSYPVFVAFDPSGNLWVATGDEGSSTIEEFKPPFSSSSVAAVTIPTELYYYCATPMVFDSTGDLFVADYTTNAIDEYTTSAISGGGTLSSANVSMPAGNNYTCMVGADASGNVYSTTYGITGGSEGAILEFSPPFSNSSTPAYTVTSGVYYPEYGGGVITKTAQLSVTL